MLHEFDLEIKDKKGSDNVIADHLSKLEINAGKEKGNEIAENFPDEQLFLFSVQTPNCSFSFFFRYVANFRYIAKIHIFFLVIFIPASKFSPKLQKLI